MRVIITGSNGFVGSALSGRLSKNKKYRIKHFQGRIENNDNVVSVIKNIDIVFNCAGVLPHHNGPETDYWDANVRGVENICKACLSGNIKLIHISTVGVFGASKHTINEKSKINLNDIYSRTKHEGDILIHKYQNKGLKAVIIRPTIGYGPGDTRPGFLNLFRYIKKGIFIPVGNEKNYLHTVFIDNLIDGLLLASQKTTAIGQDFIIGDDPARTIGKITQKIYKIFNKNKPNIYLPRSVALAVAAGMELGERFGLPAPLTVRRVKFITENRKYSITKAKKYLGYKPSIDLDKGLRTTYSWYAKENLL